MRHSDRVELFSEEAEAYVIGSLLRVPDRTLSLLDAMQCDVDWFVVPKFRYIYEAIIQLRITGTIIEQASIATYLRSINHMVFVGENTFGETIDSCKSVSNTAHYVKMMRDFFWKRKIQSVCESFHERIGGSENSEEIVSEMKYELSTMNVAGSNKSNPSDIIESITAGYTTARDTGSTGIQSGWLQLEAKLGGYMPGKVCLVGSRPKIGKTMFCCNELLSMAKRGIPVGMISLEMRESEIWERLTGADLGLDLFKFRTGKASSEQIKAFNKRAKEIIQLPITIWDGNRTIENICAIMNDAAESIRLIAIDYTQRISQSQADPGKERERYARHSNMIAGISLQTNISTIASCQLGRDAEIDQRGKRTSPAPRNIKGSGNWEEDAYQVLLISRHLDLPGDEEWDDNQPTVIRLAYNRGGPTGDLDFIFQKSKQRLVPESCADATPF